MNSTSQISLILLFVVIAVVLIGLGPLITLAAINALFQLNIAYTIWNWLAVAWLSNLFFLPRLNIAGK